MYLATCGIYSIISLSWSALMAQWYIVPIVHLTSGVRAPERSTVFCCDLHVFCRVGFSTMRPRHCMCTTFYAQLVNKSNTYTYLHVHAHTYTYIHIHAYTFKYLQIPVYFACMCMYVQVLRVCVGIILFVGIACMLRYCRYM